jgi:hypothetical protein
MISAIAKVPAKMAHILQSAQDKGRIVGAAACAIHCNPFRMRLQFCKFAAIDCSKCGIRCGTNCISRKNLAESISSGGVTLRPDHDHLGLLSSGYYLDGLLSLSLLPSADRSVPKYRGASSWCFLSSFANSLEIKANWSGEGGLGIS